MGLAVLGNEHSLILLAAGGACGTATLTEVLAEVFSPRTSVQVVLTVIAPAPEPAVSSVPFMPDPEMRPELVCQVSGCSWALSGLVQVQVMVEGSPDFTEPGFAEQESCGGFFGGSGGVFTANAASQRASPFFLDRGSETRATAV